MPRVDIKLGYSCNDHCVHCVVDDFRDALRSSGQRQDKTTEQFQEEMRESRARADEIVFTGGEPTLRRDVVELLACARDLGYRILMQSNGRRFADASFADRVVAVGPIFYCIALHGPTREVHEAVTKSRGSFDETVQGIRNLVARQQRVSAKIVLSRLNFAVVEETVAVLADLGVHRVSIAFPHALGRARKAWDEVVPRYLETLPHVHRAIDTCRRRGLEVDAETFTYCHMEGYEEAITENLQQLEDYVELRQYGDTEAVRNWSTLRREIKRKFEQCGTCRFDAVCEGPWLEYAEHFGGDEFTPLRGRPVGHVREILDGSFRREAPFLEALSPLLG